MMVWLGLTVLLALEIWDQNSADSGEPSGLYIRSLPELMAARRSKPRSDLLREVKVKGLTTEGPIDLRKKSATPAPMPVASTTTLRQPHTSDRIWTRREKLSLWGSPVHQKCSTTLRDGSGDP